MNLNEKVGYILNSNNKGIFNYLVFVVLTNLVNYVSYFREAKLMESNNICKILLHGLYLLCFHIL